MSIIEKEMNLKIESLEKDLIIIDSNCTQTAFAQDVLQLIQYTKMLQRHNNSLRKNVVELSTMLANTILDCQESNGEND